MAKHQNLHILLNSLEISAHTYDKMCSNTNYIEKELIIKSEEIFRVDTCFLRPGQQPNLPVCITTNWLA